MRKGKNIRSIELIPGITGGFAELPLLRGAWASRPEGTLNTLPTRHERGGEQKAHPDPPPREQWRRRALPRPPPPSSPPGPAPLPRRPSTSPAGNYGARAGGLPSSPLAKAAPRGLSDHLCARSGASGRPDAPATYPDDHGLVAFEFGDEFVPAEDLRLIEGPEPAHHFDAAFGWVRHRGRRQGRGAGRAGGRDRRRGRRPRTAPPAARPPPAAATKLLSRSSRIRRTGSSRRSETGWVQPISLRPRRLQTYLPGPAPRPGRTARDHAAGGQAMRRLRGSPGSALAGPCAPSHPASAPARSRPALCRVPPPWPSRGESRKAETRPALSAEHPGTCSRATCRWKDQDAWSWLWVDSGGARVQPPTACGSGLAAQAKHRMEVIANTPG